MATVHEQIDELIAAAVHGELPAEEQHRLHVHLVECAECRELHKEQQLTHRALEESLAEERPDPALERRMLAQFRQRVPRRPSFTAFLMNLLRSRATQAIATAAILLALVQVGRALTGEPFLLSRGHNAAVLLSSRLKSPSFPGARREKLKLANRRAAGQIADQSAGALVPAAASNDGEKKDDALAKTEAQRERVIVTGSNVPTAEEAAPTRAESPPTENPVPAAQPP